MTAAVRRRAAAAAVVRTWKAGLITKTETNPFFVKMKEGATSAGEAAEGLGAVVRGQEGWRQRVVGRGGRELDLGRGEGLRITPSDSKAIVPGLRQGASRLTCWWSRWIRRLEPA